MDKILLVIFVAGAMILFAGIVISLLWNVTIATIFGVSTISFWQGCGLYILGNIMFKSPTYTKTS